MASTFNRSEIFRAAWRIAKRTAQANGGSAKSHFAESLHTAWFNAKMAKIENTAAPQTADGIARGLRYAAERCGYGATPKQISYLASLMIRTKTSLRDLGLEVSNNNAMLTCHQASAWIDQLKAA